MKTIKSDLKKKKKKKKPVIRAMMPSPRETMSPSLGAGKMENRGQPLASMTLFRMMMGTSYQTPHYLVLMKTLLQYALLSAQRPFLGQTL